MQGLGLLTKRRSQLFYCSALRHTYIGSDAWCCRSILLLPQLHLCRNWLNRVRVLFFLMPMHHLVTGGAGFIGSHLIDRLMADPAARVTCLDNLYTGSLDNLNRWLDDQRFSFIEADVSDPLCLQVDQIWHLACPASPPHCQSDPITTARTCVLGTLNILELAHRSQARVLFTSTNDVYGDPLVVPQSEAYLGNVNSIGPRACYDEGKRMAETLCFDYARLHRVSIAVARIFNTYGPRMNPNDGSVIANFIGQALRGEPLTLYGDGLQTRSFCYVDDLIDGLIALMNCRSQGPVNLGNPQEITVANLARRVIEMVNPSLSVIHQQRPQDDPERCKPDITRAQFWLDWQPSVPLKSGLLQTISHLRSALELPASIAA
jgi:UDP-glucuronate decarboxylase